MKDSNELYHLPYRRPYLLYVVNFCTLVAGILIGLSLATQYVAHQLHYRPELGTPLIGRFYNPLDFILWQVNLGGYPYIQQVIQKGTAFLIVPLAVSILLALFFTIYYRLKAKRTDVHGSARWAGLDDITKAGLLGGEEGVYVGAWADKKNRLVRYLKYKGDSHVLAFAPTRSGKGVGLVLPTLLAWPHSVLVHDIKGENWALTAGWRKEKLGSTVIKFDPTSADGSTACFNPLFEVRVGKREVRDVQNIVDMIIDPDGRDPKDHWRKSAHAFLVGAILHVLYAEKDKSLRGVAHLLSNPSCSLEETLKRMLSTVHDPEGKHGWVDHATGQTTQTHPTVSAAARDLLNKAAEERSSIVSTAVSFLTLFRDPVIAENTSRSDFRVADLMNQEQPVSLYLIVPPSDIGRTRPLVRLILNQISNRLTEKMEFIDGRGRSEYRHRLLLMLDEFPALGRIESFQTALSYMAGYGIQAYLITQDLSQLYAAYGKDESFISNCHVRIAYAPNKTETAELVSKMTGLTTVMKYTRNFIGRRMNLVLANVSEGMQEVQRPMLNPDEAMRLPENDSLVFIGNHPPIYGKKIKYYQDKTFSERSKIQPPQVSDRLPFDPAGLGLPDCESVRTVGVEKESDDEDLVKIDLEESESGPADKYRL